MATRRNSRFQLANPSDLLHIRILDEIIRRGLSAGRSLRSLLVRNWY